MRPPEFTGGNVARLVVLVATAQTASMRPPEFTGGNPGIRRRSRPRCRCFNEAAGIHRRKHAGAGASAEGASECFNEAAGIHRRKRPGRRGRLPAALKSFNEAAGIHRRKPATRTALA